MKWARSVFGKLPSLFVEKTGPSRSRVEEICALELPGQPMTKALLLRAATLTDDTERWLRDMKSHRKMTEPATLRERVRSAIMVVGFDVTVKAMKSIGRELVLPTFPVPADMPLVIAFNIFVIYGISGPAEAEGYKFELPELAGEVTPLLLQMRDDEEVLQNQRLGVTAFREIAMQDAPNVRYWHDNIMELCSLYIARGGRQGATADARSDELKDIDVIPLCGSCLQALLDAAEVMKS